jgi:hypothetical protein
LLPLPPYLNLHLPHLSSLHRVGALLRAEDGTASTADLDLARRLEKPVKFVYVTSPAWYPQAKETKDCRSAQRIGRWNELAAEKALKEGWSVVDAGELSRPMQQDTRLMDGVHCTFRLSLSAHVEDVKWRGDETDNFSLFLPSFPLPLSFSRPHFALCRHPHRRDRPHGG